MKISGLSLQICAVGMVMFAVAVMAQDADKQKLIEMEKTFAANPNNGPETAALAKQYYYDGNLVQLTGIGQIGTLPKARVLEVVSKPNPADPDVKSSQTVSDFRVELYGDTALVAYKMTNTDTGHKDAALNVTDHYGCLDTFVKVKGQWLFVGNACSYETPLSKAKMDAIKKSMTQQQKDVQQAYH
jgi:hypothetical protein